MNHPPSSYMNQSAVANRQLNHTMLSVSPQIRISANENAVTASAFNRSASMKVHNTRDRNRSSDVVFKRNLPDISKFKKPDNLPNNVVSNLSNQVNTTGSNSNINSTQIRLDDFSTPTQLNENFLNSLNSNKLVKLNSLKHKNQTNNNADVDGTNSLARSTLKTSSFHNYRRYSRTEDNLALFMEFFESCPKRITERKQKFKSEIEADINGPQLINDKPLLMDLADKKQEISGEEREELYCEILYTIKHKIGQTIQGHNDYQLDLYKYAQEVFKMGNADHERLFAQTSEVKPPCVILNVEVIEARNLEAKDANGFSDPYCMLGVIPGSRATKNSISDDDTLNGIHPNANSLANNHVLAKTQTAAALTVTRKSSKDSTPKEKEKDKEKEKEKESSSKTSFIKRFSSFRRSEKTEKTEKSKHEHSPLANPNSLAANQSAALSSAAAQTVSFNSRSSVKKSGGSSTHTTTPKTSIFNSAGRDKLPAKYIQTTDVKMATLNPVWNEKFRFQIEDPDTDTLHLDIWDHDDEFSVFEAAKKLNEVKGFKGLDRYFKQIAQSARSNKEDNVDDFLGSVNIRLNNLPSNGVERWFELEGRTEKSRVEGAIRLRLKLATREDRGGSIDENETGNWNDFNQQQKLMELFIRHELNSLIAKQSQIEYEQPQLSYVNWNGQLSKEAKTILHQHAIQGDLTDFQIAICRWIVLSKMFKDYELNYKLLFDCLDELDQIWPKSSPTREEIETLRDSFESFIKYCFNLITRIRDAFPITKSMYGLTKLEHVLTILSNIYKMDAFKHACPFKNSLLHELVNLIKVSTLSWFEQTVNHYIPQSAKNDDDYVKRLIEFMYVIYLDMYILSKYYKPIFENVIGFQYFTLYYKKIDNQLIDLIKQIFIDEFGEEILKYVNSTQSFYAANILSGDVNPIPALSKPSGISNSTSQNVSINNVGVNESMSGSFEMSQGPRGSLPGTPAVINSSKDSHGTPQPGSPVPNGLPSFVYKYNTINETTAIHLFEIFSCLAAIARFKNYLNENDRNSLKINNYHELFYMPFRRWIELLRRKIEFKVERSFENEKNDVLTEVTKYSSSSVEVCNCFTQVVQFWKLISWPDHLGYQATLQELLENLSRFIIKYCTIVKEMNCQILACPTSGTASRDYLNANAQLQSRCTKLDLFQRILITTNNIERVRDSFKNILNEIDYYRIHMSLEKVDKSRTLEANRIALESCIQKTSDLVQSIVEQILELIVNNKIESNMQTHLFYMFESPESAPARESVSRLLQYLDTNLALYKDYAYKANFDSLLKVLWIRLLKIIEESLRKDDVRSIMFYNKMSECLDIIVEFLNADDQGLSKEILISEEKYKELKRYLRLQTLDTPKLIQLYYQEMVQVQNTLKTSEYGKLSFRTYYHAKDETLVIEIMKCKNLVPMDQNGLSDPFVEIMLCPRFIFTNCDKQTTSVIKKTLNPTFDEKFEFKVPEKQCIPPGHVIHFTVMDHDLVWTNDFEGEAFFDLSAVPGVRGDATDGFNGGLKSFELPLIHPKEFPSKILEVLELRTQDKMALEFLKMRRDKLK